jgi:hypothetical protein
LLRHLTRRAAGLGLYTRSAEAVALVSPVAKRLGGRSAAATKGYGTTGGRNQLTIIRIHDPDPIAVLQCDQVRAIPLESNGDP